MTAKLNLMQFANNLAAGINAKALQPVIEKELLHYEILMALDKDRILEKLVFQGGTCLRLCYGSERFSEDLDFSARLGDKDMPSLDKICDSLRSAISKRYECEVTVMPPKVFPGVSTLKGSSRTKQEPEYVKLTRWRVQVNTAPARPDIPQQRINVEIADVTAHTKAVLPLRMNYPDLPQSYSDVLIPTETLEEICADKLLALAVAPYTRYRDVWDLRWVSRNYGFRVGVLPELLSAKLDDYQAGDMFDKKAKGLVRRLPDIIQSNEFYSQMLRFLPPSTVERTLAKETFRVHLIEQITKLYRVALRFAT